MREVKQRITEWYEGKNPPINKYVGWINTSVDPRTLNLFYDGEWRVVSSDAGNVDEIVEKVIDELDDTKVGKNKFNSDPSIIYSDHYLKEDGSFGYNTDYCVSGNIPLKPNTTYCLSCVEGYPLVTNTNVKHIFYDADENIIDTFSDWGQGDDYPGITVFTTPENCATFRFSYRKDRSQIMLEEGDHRTAYEPYKETSVIQVDPKDGSITYNTLEASVNNRVINNFNGIKLSNNALEVEEKLVGPVCHITSNLVFSVKVEQPQGPFTIASCDLDEQGHPQSQLFGSKLVVNPLADTAYFIKWVKSGDTIVESIRDTISLDSPDWTEVTLFLYTNQNTSNPHDISYPHLTVIDILGNKVCDYSFSETWGNGRFWVENSDDDPTHTLNVSASWYCTDIDAKIWIFGDSYFDYSNPARWPYYTYSFYSKVLSNHFPGQEGMSGIDDLTSLLSFNSVPTYLLWMHGMNGKNTSPTDERAAYQKSIIDKVLAICTEYGIIPILTTIPSVPSVNDFNGDRTQENAYVRSTGCRYVDWETAVHNNEFNTWYPGLLESPDAQGLRIHPTEAGAAVLNGSVIRDFPEINQIYK